MSYSDDGSVVDGGEKSQRGVILRSGELTEILELSVMLAGTQTEGFRIVDWE